MMSEPKITFSSTCATYGEPEEVPIRESQPQHPINPYGFTKLDIEHALADYARAYGWGYAALRYFNAAGASADGDLGEDHAGSESLPLGDGAHRLGGLSAPGGVHLGDTGGHGGAAPGQGKRPRRGAGVRDEGVLEPEGDSLRRYEPGQVRRV